MQEIRVLYQVASNDLTEYLTELISKGRRISVVVRLRESIDHNMTTWLIIFEEA